MKIISLFFISSIALGSGGSSSGVVGEPPIAGGASTQVWHGDKVFRSVNLGTDVGSLLPLSNITTGSSPRGVLATGGGVNFWLNSGLNGVLIGSTGSGIDVSFISNTSATAKYLRATGNGSSSTGIGLVQPDFSEFAGTVSDGQLATPYVKADGTRAMTGALNLGTHKVNNVVDPTSAQDAATKSYVDTQLAQLNPKAAVYAASTANVAGTYVNAVGGICIGDTFTTTATTAFALDSVSPAIGARVLLKDQSSTFQDGVWTLTTQAVGGVSGAVLTRALDDDSSVDFNAGQIIPIQAGILNIGASYYRTSTSTTCNSDAQTWTIFQKSLSAYLLVNAPAFVGVPDSSSGNPSYGGRSGIFIENGHIVTHQGSVGNSGIGDTGISTGATTGTCTLVNGSNDIFGGVTLTTSATNTNATMCTVNFGQGYSGGGGAPNPFCVITPTTSRSAIATTATTGAFFVSSVAASFTINNGTSPLSGTFGWTYHCGEAHANNN